MIKNIPITRRRFLAVTGTTAAGLLISGQLPATSINKPQLRIGMVSDIHYADADPSGTRFYREALPKVKEFIEMANRERLDFIIELGDLKDQDKVPNESNTLRYLTDIEAVFQQFNGHVYHVLGNHDMDSISKEQFLSHVVNTGISASQSYYSFNKRGFHFVVLDANFTKEGKSYDHGNYVWTDAFIPPEQVDWLKNDLKSNKLPVIVFIHQMLDESLELIHCPKNAGEIREILEESGKVICVFQGHVHKENYNLINKIHYYSVNAVVDNKGMENNSYMIVDVFKDKRIVVNGFRHASTREFKVI
jgi:predicted phosphodiesterase